VSETPHGITVGHPEAVCGRCGGPNIVWYAPNDLWSRAMPGDGIVCPLCFVVAARAVGIDPVWRMAPEGEMELLAKTIGVGSLKAAEPV
jgi:hypothetical protein